MAYGAQAVDNADVFVGRVTMSAYEPYPMLTGGNYSSLTPSSAGAVHWFQPQPIVVRNVVFQDSLSAGVPGATSQASTGSEALTYAVSAFLYGRQDYTSNSSVLSPLGSASFGLTATLGYSSTSQQFGLSWVTNSSGGSSGLSTTSSDAAWSNYINGARVVNMPFVTTLTAGEYWMLVQHSSTSNTSNSNVTLMSLSQLQIAGQLASFTCGVLGGTTTTNSPFGAANLVGFCSVTQSLTTTISRAAISDNGARGLWFALSNA